MAKYEPTPEHICHCGACSLSDALDAKERANYRASIRETERRAHTTGAESLAWAMDRIGTSCTHPPPGPTQTAHDKRVGQLLSENCRLRCELANAEAERDAALARIRELEADAPDLLGVFTSTAAARARVKELEAQA